MELVKKPEVSVIMPCYNHVGYLPEAIESVLGQSFGDLELIVVDDSSTDGSAGVIGRYKKGDSRVVALYHDSNKGVSRSRNEAVSMSRGNFIAFADSDDIWEPHKLRVQLEHIRKRGCDVVYSDSVLIKSDGRLTGRLFSSVYGKRVKSDLFEELCVNNFINTQTVLFRRSCINAAGLFEEDFIYLEDWIYWLKLARNYAFSYIDEPLARYRIHFESTNRNRKGYAEHKIRGYLFALKKYPDIPAATKSKMLYHLGMNYMALGEKEKAHVSFLKSFRSDILNIKSLARLFYCS